MLDSARASGYILCGDCKNVLHCSDSTAIKAPSFYDSTRMFTHYLCKGCVTERRREDMAEACAEAAEALTKLKKSNGELHEEVPQAQASP